MASITTFEFPTWGHLASYLVASPYTKDKGYEKIRLVAATHFAQKEFKITDIKKEVSYLVLENKNSVTPEIGTHRTYTNLFEALNELATGKKFVPEKKLVPNAQEKKDLINYIKNYRSQEKLKIPASFISEITDRVVEEFTTRKISPEERTTAIATILTDPVIAQKICMPFLDYFDAAVRDFEKEKTESKSALKF